MFQVILIIIAMIGIAIREKKRRAANYLDSLKEMVDDYFKDIDAEQKTYRSGWSLVEEWKRQMRDKADQIKERFQKENESTAVSEAFDELSESLENGLRVIQDGNNPLVVKEGKGRDEKLTGIQKWIFWGLCLFGGTFIYLSVSAEGAGIAFITVLFTVLIVAGALPNFLKKNSQALRLFCAFCLCVLGFILNSWTYEQAENVQIAVTVGLPIVYGLIYYVLKHKKTVREV